MGEQTRGRIGLGLIGACLATALLLTAGPAAASAAGSSSCPGKPKAAAFDAATLRALNAKEWSFGPRPTGSRAQNQMVHWLQRRLDAIDGLRMRSRTYRVESWRHPDATLDLATAAGKVKLHAAAPVLLSRRTGKGGVTAPLAYVPADQSISAANSEDRIVVREAPPGSVPMGVFFPGALGFDVYDPAGTLSSGDPFGGDFLNYNARVHDLRDARAAGATGVIFLKDLPRHQLIGHNEPYEGVRWGVPAAFMGADEAAAIRTASEDPNARATLRLSAKKRRVKTRTLFATLPGPDRRKLVVDSHTDGTNAVEDNGPVAMLAMARYLAGLSAECRGRTIEFAFQTGHFYQHIASPDHRHGGAGVLSRNLNRQYDDGKVAGVMVLEHLGARDYAAVPRGNGVGDVLRPTGEPAVQQVAVSPSDALRAATSDAIRAYDVTRTVMLTGAEFPVAGRVPSQCSFGGEGTPYNEQLLPTVAAISAPLTLYDPAFGLEGIDFKRMSSETLAFTDLLLGMGQMDADAIAGDVTAERASRDDGAPGCPSDI
jgi:hypothetical protein